MTDTPTSTEIQKDEYAVRIRHAEDGIYPLEAPEGQDSLREQITRLVEAERMVWCHASGQLAKRKSNPKYARFVDARGNLEPNQHAVVLRDISNTRAAWMCSKCHRVGRDQLSAEECCRPLTCACGESTKYRRLECDACVEKRISEVNTVFHYKRLAKITNILTLDEYDVAMVRFEDEYLDTDECYTDEPHWDYGEIGYVMGCVKNTSLPKFDAKDLLNELTEQHDMNEDLAESVLHKCDVVELQKVLDAWSETQPYTAYYPDPTTAVVLHTTKAELEESIADAKAKIEALRQEKDRLGLKLLGLTRGL